MYINRVDDDCYSHGGSRNWCGRKQINNEATRGRKYSNPKQYYFKTKLKMQILIKKKKQHCTTLFTYMAALQIF